MTSELALRELIAKWRKYAQACKGGEPEFRGAGHLICAGELEAALADSEPGQGQFQLIVCESCGSRNFHGTFEMNGRGFIDRTCDDCGTKWVLPTAQPATAKQEEGK